MVKEASIQVVHLQRGGGRTEAQKGRQAGRGAANCNVQERRVPQRLRTPRDQRHPEAALQGRGDFREHVGEGNTRPLTQRPAVVRLLQVEARPEGRTPEDRQPDKGPELQVEKAFKISRFGDFIRGK